MSEKWKEDLATIGAFIDDLRSQLAQAQEARQRAEAEVARLCKLPRESFTKHLNLSRDQRAYSWHEIQYLLEQWEIEQRRAMGAAVSGGGSPATTLSQESPAREQKPPQPTFPKDAP